MNLLREPYKFYNLILERMDDVQIEYVEEEVSLMGKLDSQNVSEIEKQLYEILKSRDGLKINLKNLEIKGLSGVFMLYVFKKKASSISKKVNYLNRPLKLTAGNIPGINIERLIGQSNSTYLKNDPIQN